MTGSKIGMILIGDHLGQVKKIIPESNEIVNVAGCSQPSRLNPVVSIEAFPSETSQRLIANKDGSAFKFDATLSNVKDLDLGLKEDLIKCIPMRENQGVLGIYDQHIQHHKYNKSSDTFVKIKQKKAKITGTRLNFAGDKLGYVGINIPLIVNDLETNKRIFKAEPPEKDWLGIQPECYVSNMEFIGASRIATCSRSDSVIRIYDINTCSKTKPIISINLDQTAFNEHADAARFHSIGTTGDQGHTIVVGSNVGQIIAIDLRFNVKQIPRKRLQPNNFKILGSFKGPRGASIKDVRIAQDQSLHEDCDKETYKVISCCLDRYVRIHNLSKKSRELDKQFYLITKPYCCSPVYHD